VSQTRSQLVSKVRMLCNEAPDEPLPSGLPSNLIFEELTTLESEMLRALDLSTQNRRVAVTDIPLINTDEPFTLSVTDFNAPSYVYLQTDASSNVWFPVEIVNQSSLAQKGIEGELAVAFSGTPQEGYLSWTPEVNQTLRVWYDRTGDTPTMAGSTELGSFYDDYLKLMCAAVCREHLGLPLGTMMVERLREGKEQFKKYANMSRQQGLANKSRVFTPLRYRRRYVGIDRTRFFIP
jgi:hypothetical protein